MLKPYQKWLIAGAVVLCIAVFAVWFFGAAWLEQRIKQAVAERVAASPHFKCGEIVVALRPARLIFKDAVLEMDLVAEARHLGVKSREIKLDGIDWIQLMFFKKLNINDFQVESPFVTLSDMVRADSLPGEEKVPSEEGLSAIHIARLGVESGRFKIIKNLKDTVASMAADSFDVEVGELAFKINKKGNTHTVEKVHVDIRNFLLDSDDHLHEITVKRLLLNKKDQSIALTGLHVKPKYGKQAFFSHLKYRKARLDFEFPEILLHGWQFDEMMQGRLVARSAMVNGMKLRAVTNLNIPIDPKGYKPLPQEALLKAALGITIDSMVVSKGQFNFESIAIGKTLPGSLAFDPLSAVFTNVTNDTARIRKQPMMKVMAEGWFQKAHRVVNNFRIDLSSPAYAFSFKGKASNIPFTKFNPMLTPAANFVFERGNITSLDFEVNADKSAARGKLNLAFEDLDFYLLNKKNKRSGFLSEAVDLLFVKEENNAGDDNFKKGQIFFRRDTRRPFFAYWWGAIQSGINTSILKDFALKKIQKKAAKQKAK